MILLILGVLLLAAIHWIPSIQPNVKLALINKFSMNGYKSIFSLFVLSSVGLIVVGWNMTPIEYLYSSPSSFRHITMLLMFFAFILIGSTKAPVRIKRFIRHPQLTGVVIWAVAHLLANGETRSVVLFSGIGVWAIIQIIFINKREPNYVPPTPAPWIREVKVLVISTVVMMVAMYAHQWFAGMPLFPTR